MQAQKLLDQILPILYTVKEDPIKLQQILDFLMDEIYEEPEEDDEIVVPEKYLKTVSEIADNIDAGFICFLNMDTLELEEIPKEMQYELEYLEDADDADDADDDGYNFKHHTWENCMTFEPLESHESFKIMRKFTDQLDDRMLQGKLNYALDNRKPFAKFKFLIDNSDYRQHWFDFKKHCLEIHVKELLSMELNKEDANFDLEEQN